MTDEQEDEFLTSVAAVWPYHTLYLYGTIQHRDAHRSTRVYVCRECYALYWPENAKHRSFYTDRLVPAYNNGVPNNSDCECWYKIPFNLPRFEEPIKGLRRIRDDLGGADARTPV